ncbi:ABC transporter substrate-binding protein [Brevibacterium jeotgali]|uniref:Osmoprotectant transport system substrate-binding protein n=1 Tax=Brevibacterium jeotgali TaxID=1262550 RepID=A0A2H1L7B6_9MICO|nr:ABC transporter substrate-binding protein [Brevibacterium jeotgali]TWC03137.1 osmoprotectant transport system substrate-binding protein [Brevibacterium jeotgali]SMY12804.1 osmoprotectant transport system substrate-binding protein [Brevibacterium jeotgali]
MAAAVLVTLGGCGSDPLSGGGEEAGDGPIVVSSANFTESEIIGNLYSQALESAGVDVETQFNIGSREAYIPALSDGSIDVIPEYTGNLLLFLDPEADVSSPDTIAEALPAALEAEGLDGLEPADAENKDSVVVTAETAEDWDLEQIGDLAEHGDDLTMAGPPEFAERAVGLPGLEETYGVTVDSFEPIADGGGPATVDALVGGDVQAANIFSTNPAIEAEDLVVLGDPEGHFAAQNVVPVVRQDRLTDDAQAALDAVSAELTTEDLVALNLRVSGDEKVEPATAAADWLEERGLLDS